MVQVIQCATAAFMDSARARPSNKFVRDLGGETTAVAAVRIYLCLDHHGDDKFAALEPVSVMLKHFATSCPASEPGIHVFSAEQDVDGRDGARP